MFSKFHIWTWKSKAKLTAKVKFDGHIWGLQFNQYICFLYVAIGPFLANTIPYLTLKIQGQGQG